MRFTSLVLSACILTACGGGGGDGGSQLSATQAAYESMFLSPDAAHQSSWSLPSQGYPVSDNPNLQFPYYFYDEAEQLAKSPLTGTQRYTSNGWANLTTKLSLPAPSNSSPWILADGGFYQAGSPYTVDTSYQGSNVVITQLSADNKHSLFSVSFTEATLIALTGPIVTASGKASGLLPPEIYTNAALTTPNASWKNGAAYLATKAVLATDTYIVLSDSQGPKAISGSSTIEGLIGSSSLKAEGDPTSYNKLNGTIKTVQGVQNVYVANDPITVNGVSAGSYRTFYELNQKVYAGVLIKAGTPASLGNYYNIKARESIQAALTF